MTTNSKLVFIDIDGTLADENHVVCADVGQAPLQRGPVSPADLALGLGRNGIVLRRVGALRDDLEKIPVRSLGNLPRHFARVAAM